MASYGSTAGVEALLPTLGTLDGSSSPTSTEVTTWLEDGYSIINRYLAGGGYSTPATSGMDIYNELRGLNNLYAGAIAIQARGLENATGETEVRSEQWLERFYEQLQNLLDMDLTTVGLSETTTTTTRRSRIRTLQLRRVDGYSGEFEGVPPEPDNVSE